MLIKARIYFNDIAFYSRLHPHPRKGISKHPYKGPDEGEYLGVDEFVKSKKVS